MVIKQKQNFDDECKVYNQMLIDSSLKTGFNLEYIKEYKVLDFKKETKRLNNTCPVKILDFGCGIGYSIPYLRKHFPEAVIYACDYSKASIEECRKNNKDIKNIHIKESDGIDIPFDEKFDAVFIANVIRHIPRENQKTILKNLKKVTNKYGIIMIYEFNPYNPVSLYFYFKEDKQYDKENVRIMKPSYAKNLLKSTGFENINIKYRFFVPSCFNSLLWIEKYLTNCPLGATYYASAQSFD